MTGKYGISYVLDGDAFTYWGKYQSHVKVQIISKYTHWLIINIFSVSLIKPTELNYVTSEKQSFTDCCFITRLRNVM